MRKLMERGSVKRWSVGGVAVAVMLFGTVLESSVPPAFAVGNCAGANPNDSLPDDVALQACLDLGGTTLLDTGSPGYLIANGLTITKDFTTVTSAAPGSPATLLAAPTLNAPLLSVPTRGLTLHDVTISDLVLDGNRPNRTNVTGCSADRDAQSTVVLYSANRLDFERNTITRTVCGSALKLSGTGMTVASNHIVDNGHGREAVDAPEPWADGLTLVFCSQSDVHDNDVVDATDAGIVVFTGDHCTVRNNSITQTSRHAFAGVQFGAPAPGVAGTHSGSVLQSNIIRGNALLSFGVAYGVDPWFAAPVYYGSVSGNDVSGAVVNLLVDGARAGSVGANTLSSPVGPARCPTGASTPVNLDFDPDSVGTTVSTLPDAFRSYDGCIP